MHSVKGSWVGQTFALAKNNESEGRRSRIRRSKEERKAMVESFIKKYQKLNNGSFPSLNLTHKEVGGSFYTVREIVRDIIQENRVLGPAKFTVEEQTVDQFWEHNPLGTIAAEPQNSLSVSSNESQFVTNKNQGAIEELVFASDGHLVRPESQMFENGRMINATQVEVNDREFNELKSTELEVNGPVEIEKHVAVESIVSNGHCTEPEYLSFGSGQINGSEVDMKVKEREEQTYTELQTVEPLEAKKNGEEVLATSRPKVTPIAADVMVETFPLKPVTRKPESLDGSLQVVADLTKSTEDKGTRAMESACVDSSPVDTLSSMKGMDDNVEINLSSPLVENKSSPVDEALGHAIDPSLESSNSSTFNEGIVHETGSTDLSVKSPHKDVPTSEIFEQSQLTEGSKADKAPDSLHAKNINGTSGSSELLKTKEVLVVEDEVDVQTSGSLMKGSKPTLDRINLESWEGASKKSKRPEGNPLWDVFKAFLDAFVKFWSE
ncbi:hypothetical protein D8674_030507 [Pyrus ussuriensis x Pyrus communis]|uniref:AT3G52170-like helix-turn-helix domain-containing protein n=1 Tax=Pyrus ussuriensis x Pyrus communis TaxID=2448454 RepID=A0A5N5EWC3_9ROSA|nr:hypothetical protein D8674_030507 [Pyrus ussuriensis x Pyrus communis]